MNIKHVIILMMLLSPAACDNREDNAPSAVTENKKIEAVDPVPASKPGQNIKAMDEETQTALEEPVSVMTQTKETMAGDTGTSENGVTLPSRAAALDLADKSGCLACHSVEKKVVGPAWADVSERYKGEAGIRAKLIDKVKKGGKGNWTEVTGGVPMPPYSPRVTDDTIEKLVTFVLSLAEG